MSRSGVRGMYVKGMIKERVNIEHIVHSQLLEGKILPQQIEAVWGSTIIGSLGVSVDASQITGMIPIGQLAPHTHAVANVIGLTETLALLSANINNRSLVGHVHQLADVPALAPALSAKADVTWVQAELVKKKNNPILPADVAGLDILLAQKADKTNTVNVTAADVNVTGALNVGNVFSLSGSAITALPPYRAHAYSLSLAGRFQDLMGALEVRVFSETVGANSISSCQTTVAVAWNRMASALTTNFSRNDIDTFDDIHVPILWLKSAKSFARWHMHLQ